MTAVLYGIALQWKIDFRRKDVLIMYYIMPLIFFFFMGGIFSSIDSTMKETLIYSMTIFAISAGAFVGVPTSIIGFYSTDMKKAYEVGHVPLWTPLLNSFISALLHLTIVSLIIVLLAPFLFEADALQGVLAYGGIGFCYMISAISIGLCLGLFVKSQSKLTVLSMVLFLLSIMLSGIMLPDAFLPEALKLIGDFLPSRWAYNALCGNEVIENVVALLSLFVISLGVSLVKLKRSTKG